MPGNISEHSSSASQPSLSGVSCGSGHILWGDVEVGRKGAHSYSSSSISQVSASQARQSTSRLSPFERSMSGPRPRPPRAKLGWANTTVNAAPLNDGDTSSSTSSQLGDRPSIHGNNLPFSKLNAERSLFNGSGHAGGPGCEDPSGGCPPNSAPSTGWIVSGQLTAAPPDDATAKADDSDEGEGLSLGSALHKDNKCRPCHYFHSRTGCLNGASCEYCHFKHTKKSGAKMTKAQRLQCLGLVQTIQCANTGVPTKLAAEAQLLQLTSADARLGAYATQVLRCAQGQGEFEPESAAEAARLLTACVNSRGGQIDAPAFGELPPDADDLLPPMFPAANRRAPRTRRDRDTSCIVQL